MHKLIGMIMVSSLAVVGIGCAHSPPKADPVIAGARASRSKALSESDRLQQSEDPIKEQAEVTEPTVPTVNAPVQAAEPAESARPPVH